MSLLLLPISFLMASCSATVDIALLEKPKVKLADNIQRIGIVNTINDENSPDRSLKIGGRGEERNGNIITSVRAVEGVIRAVAASPTMRAALVPIDSLTFDFENRLERARLNAYADSSNIDAYIVFDQIKTFLPVGGTIAASLVGSSSVRLDGSLQASIYITNSDQIIDGLSVKDHTFIPLSGSSNIVVILSDLSRKREHYGALGLQLGDMTGKLITPNWIWESRMFYTAGNKVLRRAKKPIRARQWADAERLLLGDDAYNKEKSRGRVIFNLALIKEAQGELDAAIVFAERAVNETNLTMAKVYLEKLQMRRESINE